MCIGSDNRFKKVFHLLRAESAFDGENSDCMVCRGGLEVESKATYISFIVLVLLTNVCFCQGALGADGAGGRSQRCGLMVSVCVRIRYNSFMYHVRGTSLNRISHCLE